MRRLNVSLSVGAVCLLFAVTLSAQDQNPAATTSPQAVVPRLMKFSGALRDAAGKPVTGPVDVTFALYSTDAGGDPLWIETQSVQADDQGRYTALIGVMHTDGLPMELFTSGEARWLGVQVANEPEQKPRVLLLSVPYALKSADAETLGGLPASAFVQTGVAPGLSPAGGSTAASARSSSGAAAPPKGSAGHKAAACSSVTSDGTATANSITMFTTSCNIESSVITQSSSNIGIGTASPSSPLSVTASGAPLPPQAAVLALGAPSGVVPFRMLQNVHASSTPALIDLETSDGKLAQLSAGGTGIFQINATAGNAMAFATNGFTPRMYIDTSGNVGIGTGTSALSSNLSLVASGAPLPPQPAVLAIGAPSGVVPFRMLQNVHASSTPALIDLETADGKLAQLSAGGTGIFQINATAGNAMAFATNGFTPRMYIDTSGNVGIGTTTPGAMLEVTGAAKFDSAVAFAGMETVATGDVSLNNGNVDLPSTNTAGTAGVINQGGAPLIQACCPNSTENIFIGNAGNFTADASSSNSGVGQNVAVGYQSLQSLTSGYQNVAAGPYALNSNADGYFNLAAGMGAMADNTSGNSNTAIGGDALFFSTDSNNNTAVGFGALNADCINISSGCTANNNTAVGFYAGNTLEGSQANITGANDTFIGYDSGPGTSTQLNNATAIGANAAVGASNALVLGSINGVNFASASVNVGIGTLTPTTTLQVAGGNISTTTAGSGLIVKSPDGTKCALIGINNTGAIAVTSVTCP